MSEGSAKYIPPEGKIVHMDSQMFASIISMIPFGKLVTIEAIGAMWAARKGADRCILGSGPLPYNKKLLFHPANVQRIDFWSDMDTLHSVNEEHLIPYWRIISMRGSLIDFATYYSIEVQKLLLEQEGHTILQSNRILRKYVVENYQDALFNLDRLIINE